MQVTRKYDISKIYSKLVLIKDHLSLPPPPWRTGNCSHLPPPPHLRYTNLVVSVTLSNVIPTKYLSACNAYYKERYAFPPSTYSTSFPCTVAHRLFRHPARLSSATWLVVLLRHKAMAYSKLRVIRETANHTV